MLKDNTTDLIYHYLSVYPPSETSARQKTFGIRHERGILTKTPDRPPIQVVLYINFFGYDPYGVFLPFILYLPAGA